MDKNTITGFVLIALVLIAFSWWSRPSEAQLQEMARQDSIAQVERAKAQAELDKQMLKAEEEELQTDVADSASAFFMAKQGTADKVTLQNEHVAVVINTQGGVVESATLKEYQDQQKQDVVLLSQEDSHFAYTLETKTENISSDQLYFQAEDSSRSDSTLTLVAEVANGGCLTLKYRLRPDSYMLDFIIKSEGLENLFSPSTKTIDLAWQNRARQQEKGVSFENRYAALTYKVKDKGTDKLNEMKATEKEIEKTLDWIDFKDQFFSCIIIAHQDFKNVTLSSAPQEKGTGYLKAYKAEMQTAFDPSGKQATEMQTTATPFGA